MKPTVLSVSIMCLGAGLLVENSLCYLKHGISQNGLQTAQTKKEDDIFATNSKERKLHLFLLWQQGNLKETLTAPLITVTEDVILLS